MSQRSRSAVGLHRVYLTPKNAIGWEFREKWQFEQ
jgi:hypothetical protein